jgi:alanine-synthesizing transaminase
VIASRRLRWAAPSNRLTRLLAERRARGAEVLDLTETNPTRVGLPYPAEEIAAALAGPGAARYDPEPRGLPAAREAVSAFLASRGLEAPPERIVLTASTSEAYAFLFKVLCDPGDPVLVPRPSYPLFDYLAALEAVRPVPYPLSADEAYAVDPAAVERAAETLGPEGTRALIVVSPNNPTGTAVRERGRRALEELAARRGLAIIADEVFFDFLHGPEEGAAAPGRGAGARRAGAGDPIVSFLAPRPGRSGAAAPTFTLGGLSKACGLPQMKLGWIVVGGPDDEVAGALDRLDLVADTYLSVGTPVQRAAGRLLEIGEGIAGLIRERVRLNRGALAAALAGAPSCRALPADGGWSVVLEVPALGTEEDLVLALLGEDGVLAHPGYFFDFPRGAHLVLSLLPEPGRFREGVLRILARVLRPPGS